MTLFVVDVFSLATRSATHSQRFGDPLLGRDPPAEKHWLNNHTNENIKAQINSELNIFPHMLIACCDKCFT